MNDNKPWYEKISIWITIVAGICAILGISVFSNKSLFKDDKNSDAVIRFENNEIGDQSTVIVGDGNTINYGEADSGNMESSQLDNLPMQDSDYISVIASYDSNTPQTSLNGVNILVNAETSFSAERVTISAASDNYETEPLDMHGGKYEWYFTANFYIKGTYTVTITAYTTDGKSVSDTFEYIY